MFFSKPRLKFYFVVFCFLSLFFSCKGYGNYWDNKDTLNVPPPATPQNQVVAPVFVPPAGEYYPIPASVTVSSTTPGAKICYTTNGAIPSCDASKTACAGGSLDTVPVTTLVNGSVLRAIACSPGMADSFVTSGSYIYETTAPTVGTPIAFGGVSDSSINASWGPASDNITTAANLQYRIVRALSSAAIDTVAEVDAVSGADLVQDYTANTTSIASSGLTALTTYWFAVVVKDEAGNKSIYTPQSQQTSSAGTVGSPSFAPPAGLYGVAQSVTITSATAGATICYTTSGISPACDVPKTGCSTGTAGTPASIAATATLKAMACKSGYADSIETSGLYTIDTLVPTTGAAISFGAVTDNSIVVNWGAAADNVTSTANLKYRLVKALLPTSIDTIAEVDAVSGADLIFDYTANTTSGIAPGLVGLTSYSFAVVVQDEAGNKTLYSPVSQMTIAVGTVSLPSFSVPAGLYNITQSVTITSATPLANICYTTNGSSPACNALKTGCSTGTLYTASVLINTTTTLKARACLLAWSDSSEASNVYTIDTVLPTVTNVTSAKADGAYTAGTTITVDIVFSEPVDVTGTPQLTLATGSPATTPINYVSGSGSATLSFTYTVAAGNWSPDLDYAAAGSLSLNGGTIQDTAGNNATLTLPAPGGANSLGANKALVVDAVLPALTVSTPTAGATGVAVCSGGPPCTAKIVLQFSESMQTTSPTLTTEIDSNGSYVATPNNNTIFTWTTTTYTNDTLTIALSWYWFPENSLIRYTIPAVGLKDIAGNDISAQLQQTFTTGWAGRSFQVADTGQATCYNVSTPVTCSDSGAYPRQDGFYSATPVARSFTGPTVSGSDYTTKDNVTNLVWKTCTEGLSGSNCSTGSALPATSWNDAVNLCSGLNLGAGYAGIKTWRLPTAVEFETITDYTANAPAITIAEFPGIPATSYYWASTTYAVNTANAWRVYSGGSGSSSGTLAKTTATYYVRCVSGGAIQAASTFTVASETVTDSSTGLTWQKCSRGQNASTCSGTATVDTWANALTYCKGLSLDSKTTWRLPSVTEMLSIVDKSKANPAIDASVFPNSSAAPAWTSSYYMANPTVSEWTVNFVGGYLDAYARTNNYTARCVSP